MSFLGVVVALHQALVVSPAGPYERVADALRAADPGDTVMVRAGVYREPTVRIDRAVVVMGDSGAILDGEGQRELLVIAAPGVTVRGLTFRHTGRSHREDRAALRVLQTHDCLIADNRFVDTFFGIYLQGEGGLASVNEDVLSTYGYRDAAQLRPYVGGNLGLEWFQINPHYALAAYGGVRDYLQNFERTYGANPPIAWVSGLAKMSCVPVFVIVQSVLSNGSPL